MAAATDADTIHALSSGAVPAAIAIVRISGPRADAALRAMVGRLPPPRRASMRVVRDENGEPIDRALVLRFPGPDSATGEDVVELHLHGGRAVVAAAMRALAALGSRPAEPGEFTRRSLLSGRIDYAEAEGLADLLEAETEAQRRDALRRSEGALGRLARDWHDRLLDVAARVEFAIDHDEDELVDLATLHDAIRRHRVDLDAVLAAPSISRLRAGFRVVLAGPPNVGKSSLFNRLIGSDAAIVSDRPGTTRDLNERAFALDGLPYLLVDTAGLRDSDDAIEREGVARARRAMADADIVLDLGTAPAASDRTIAVAAKADLGAPAAGRLAVSAVTGAGIGELLAAISRIGRTLVAATSDVALDDRHRAGLTAARAELAAGEAEVDAVLVAERVRSALAAVGGLTGYAATEEVLTALFARFCLGK